MIEIVPGEVQVTVDALYEIAKRLPKDLHLPAPLTAEEIKQAEPEQGNQERVRITQTLWRKNS